MDSIPVSMKIRGDDLKTSNKIECKLPVDKTDFINRWVTTSTEAILEDDCMSEICESSVYSSSIVDSEDLETEFSSINLGNSTDNDSRTLSSGHTTTQDGQVMNMLQNVFNGNGGVQTLGDVVIHNSTGVHVGNVTYITGPIHITHTGGGSIGTINQNHNSSGKSDIKTTPTSTTTNQRYQYPDADGLGEEEREESNADDAFLGNIPRRIINNVLRTVDRRTWLAQRALEPYDYIEGPVQYVIISHTATEMATTQAENIYILRHIQCFHIESRRWNDISYNFMIGCDGNAYEGRGWKVVGAHAYGYNKKSVGISFVGCFMRELPSQISLNACKLLIKRGIELGHIAPDYKLLAHCQCSATESPGRKLFEELQTWPHFTHLSD